MKRKYTGADLCLPNSGSWPANQQLNSFKPNILTQSQLKFLITKAWTDLSFEEADNYISSLLIHEEEILFYSANIKDANLSLQRRQT